MVKWKIYTCFKLEYMWDETTLWWVYEVTINDFEVGAQQKIIPKLTNKDNNNKINKINEYNILKYAIFKIFVNNATNEWNPSIHW